MGCVQSRDKILYKTTALFWLLLNKLLFDNNAAVIDLNGSVIVKLFVFK